MAPRWPRCQDGSRCLHLTPHPSAIPKGSAGEVSHSCARISWRAGAVSGIFCHLLPSSKILAPSFFIFFHLFFIFFHLSYLSPSFRILGMAKPVLYDIGGLPGSGQSFFKRAEASRPVVQAPKMELAQSWRKPG